MNARQTHEKGSRSDAHADCVCSDRPTSTRPVDDRLRHLNLAVSFAHEADRLAGTKAADTYATLAHFWLNLAREERP